MLDFKGELLEKRRKSQFSSYGPFQLPWAIYMIRPFRKAINSATMIVAIVVMVIPPDFCDIPNHPLTVAIGYRNEIKLDA